MADFIAHQESNLFTINTLISAEEMNLHLDEVWELLTLAYAKVKGGLNYTNKDELLKSSAQWQVIKYKDTIIAVTVYKAKKA